jgi:site-specific recombinase XerD
VGRHAEGWKIRIRDGEKTYKVYWRSVEDQRRYEFSTGETDAKRATEAAARIYSDHTSGKVQVKSRGVKPGPSLALEDVAVDWIEAMIGQISKGTLASYSGYFESHLVKAFPTLGDLFDEQKKSAYLSDRLKKVQGKTVRKELSALRGLASWAHQQGLIDSVPTIPSVPKRAMGTNYQKRRRAKADRLEVEELEAFLAGLPESTRRLGIVRARFVLQYEMALRSSTVDRLECPKNWSPGLKYLVIPAGDIKGREDTEKLLTKRAFAALEASYKKPGVIFGHHDYRVVVAAAAAKALPPDKAKKFTMGHLRSVDLTHMADAGAGLSALQEHADHKLATTTNVYLRRSKKALEEELKRQGKL